MRKRKDSSEFKIDFIGLGAPKCGTTTIAKWLEEHPEISMPCKETNYFAKYHAPSQEPRDLYKERGIEGYKEIFYNRRVDFSKESW